MSLGLHDPPLGESDTRSKLIDPALRRRGWTEEHIRREVTLGAVEIIDGKPRPRSKGRSDYLLRLKVAGGKEPVAVAVIEAKAESLPWRTACSLAMAPNRRGKGGVAKASFELQGLSAAYGTPLTPVTRTFSRGKNAA